jgi:hydrogenase maturation protease
VRTLTTHQLTPELAGTLADVQHAIFVDACLTTTNQAEVRLVQVTALQTARLTAHLSDPQALLALTQAAYGRAPCAWMLAIPATRFDYGAALSPATAACITSALTLLRTLFKTIRTNHA